MHQVCKLAFVEKEKKLRSNFLTASPDCQKTVQYISSGEGEVATRVATRDRSLVRKQLYKHLVRLVDAILGDF
jgi:hypothetical protein